MEFEIVKTDTPDRSLLLLADESEESVADYAGRGTTYAACRNGQILGQYVLLHTRPFTAEVVNIAVAPEYQRRGIDEDYFRKHYPAPIFENGVECRHMVRLRMELR